MPPRLMHKKSRMGCKRCKTRKVKCDEERPICGACKRHSLECIYIEPGPPAPRREASQSAQTSSHRSPGSSDSHTPAPSSSTGGPDGSIPDRDDGQYPVTDERRVLELQLMHRYMQSFSDIFVGIHNSNIAEVWRDLVPSMGIHHPFLLHALYAVTTLHVIVTKTQAREDLAQLQEAGVQPVKESIIPTLIPSAPPVTDNLDVDDMRRAHSLYFDLAVRGQRMAVSNLNPDNADAVCMATILISNQGFLLDHDLDMNEPEYIPPVQWMLLASSVSTVLRACAGMLGSKAATSLILSSGRGLNLSRYNDIDNDTFFKPILDFSSASETADIEVYQQVLDFIAAIRLAALGHEPVSILSRRFFSFATLIPNQFIGMVRQSRPRALVIMACFFALTKEVEGIWWFRGAGEKHVRGLQTLIPLDWHWALKWPLGMVDSRTPETRQALLHQSQFC